MPALAQLEDLTWSLAVRSAYAVPGSGPEAATDQLQLFEIHLYSPQPQNVPGRVPVGSSCTARYQCAD